MVITNLFNKILDFKPGAQNVLQIIQSNYLDWMHACGGKGRCTTCKMIVLEGMANLSPLSPAEKQYRQRGLLMENERLACQVKVTGDVKIKIPEKNKFPHIQYSD